MFYIELAWHAETPVPTLKGIVKRCCWEGGSGGAISSSSHADTSWSSSSPSTPPRSTLGASWSLGWPRVMNHFTCAERDRGRQTAEQGRTTVDERFWCASLLAMQAEGYTAIELHDLAACAMHEAVMRSTTPQDVDADAAVRILCHTLHL
ncbi:hypothetical protein FIBSPDRAFT_958621 [Athelia psychrophila]|uniref:Uncharacterized protein n=1 Tax=Athelia psychrophila TaxID=1759441 RepID=A0A166EBT3_9AGAM|nr:hypothetical protein FIBSPDRAFT_958621 [Fibularhizoctonia sp. CBS 109695]